MNKILITGGAGFVGRRFVQYFLDRGDCVVCVDSLASHTGAIDPKLGWPFYDPFTYDNFVFIHMDCRIFFKSNDEDDYDYVFHLAAMVGGRLLIDNDPLVVADDLSIDSEYWQWAKKNKPKKTICFSSSAAYPVAFQQESSYRLLSESMIDFQGNIGMPDMTYGWAKLTNEYLARLAYEKYGLRSVCYRPFSGYGEDQDNSYPFPSICKRVISEHRSGFIKVWGSGRQMRDFIHIDDCVQGVIKTMDKINNGAAINLSTGILTSFLDLTKKIAKLHGGSIEVIGSPEMPAGVFARGGDTSLQRELGFTHKIQLEQGIKMALDIYARNN
ncbi:NAD-dependent epimerase/dehydratase family protein [Polynucleobacter paneuropaeus]|nr:NAD-dependent epimerase/dehydratase family protein [Polynucleobacter paneuropaeus]QWD09516.1 NAD-dependent epimerase/dehydratase family protein [Polynucleobacter paneuropaeus]